jgi:hypothetical protein
MRYSADSFSGASFARSSKAFGKSAEDEILYSYTSGAHNVRDSKEYNIQLIFEGEGWTTQLQQSFVLSADAISDYILGDVPNTSYGALQIDDVRIQAQLIEIDGPGGILGGAGVSLYRGQTGIPIMAIMQFDVADVGYFDSIGLFDDIVLHEMLHSVGAGSGWNRAGLIGTDAAGLPVFTGPMANAIYPGDAFIPIENDGGQGTAYVHWDEQTFGGELMTGWIDVDNDLSYMTIASLGDLGYSIISGANYVPPTFI